MGQEVEGSLLVRFDWLLRGEIRGEGARECVCVRVRGGEETGSEESTCSKSSVMQ